MKNWTIIIILLTCTIVACNHEQSHEITGNWIPTAQIAPVSDTVIDDTIIFQSGSNGLADITITIIPDGTFSFYMRTIAQPMSDDDENEMTWKGKWNKEDNWIALTFTKEKPILEALFDSNYAEKYQFEILNDSTVNINTSLPKLDIWGVGCEKITK